MWKKWLNWTSIFILFIWTISINLASWISSSHIYTLLCNGPWSFAHIKSWNYYYHELFHSRSAPTDRSSSFTIEQLLFFYCLLTVKGNYVDRLHYCMKWASLKMPEISTIDYTKLHWRTVWNSRIFSFFLVSLGL
jgi:hypothetical protein